MGSPKRPFEEHYKKLETLSKELQENQVSIDELVPRMKEALESFKVCNRIDVEPCVTAVENELTFVWRLYCPV